MTISTIEELERLPAGSLVRANAGTTTDWSRVIDGFQSGRVVLGLDMFTGFVAAGQVQDLSNTRPEPSEWWVHRHYWYYILGTEDSAVRVVRIRRLDGEHEIVFDTIAVSFFERTTVNRSTVFPEGLLTEARFMELMRLVSLSRTESETAATEVRTLKNRPAPSVIRPQVETMRATVANLHAELGTLLGTIGRD